MRLINADDLKNTFRQTYRFCFNYKQYKRLQEEKQIIDNAPTVDAVPVVRCHECKHRYYYENDDIKPVCTRAMAYANTPDDWFCTDGERKGGDE